MDFPRDSDGRQAKMQAHVLRFVVGEVKHLNFIVRAWQGKLSNSKFMDSQKVDMYLMTAGNIFPTECLPSIREKLLQADEDKLLMVQSAGMKKPMVAFWLNFFLGNLGAEYFYLGKTGLGIVKLLTCGVAGIWSFINLFTIIGYTKRENYKNFTMLL